VEDGRKSEPENGIKLGILSKNKNIYQCYPMLCFKRANHDCGYTT
jgi:hypothetical protein